MEASPSEWVMIYDHDIFLANPNWYDIILRHIEEAPDGGLFTCVTNRIGNPHQKVGADKDNHDLRYHWEFAKAQKGKPLRLAKQPISGLIMVTSKTVWKAAGGFEERKSYFGVDNAYHKAVKKAGYKVYIIDDLYVYHRYRA